MTARSGRGLHIGQPMTKQPISYYARALRPALSPDAFEPARSRLFWLPVHLAVIALGMTTIARGWLAWPLVPLLSLVMGVSFSGLTFLAHETLHGAIIRSRGVRWLVGFIGFLPFVISPRLWCAWHNRVHHGHANEPDVDPDAYPTLEAYSSDRKIRVVTDHFAPGRRRLSGQFALTVGLSIQGLQMLAVARSRGYLSARAHRVALAETALGIGLWTALALLVGGLPFLFVFVLPTMVANTIVMAFIFTNHSLSPLTDVNDPLENSLSVTVPRWVDWITLRFGFHVEHHLFPAMSSRHALAVRALLLARWPDRYQSMPLTRALLLLHRSGRVYKDHTALYDPHTGVQTSSLRARKVALA